MKNQSKILLMLPGAVDAMNVKANDKVLSALTTGNIKFDRETLLRMIGDTAIVSVMGPLLNNLSLFEYLMGYNSYGWVLEDLRRALADEKVARVILDFDSPGGSSSEMFETARYIRGMAGQKPIYAWVGSMACSAAYGLASACNKIYANPAAEIGSVGTMLVASHQEEPDGDGVRYIQVVASDSPLKNADPTTPEGLQSYVERLNAINGQFIELLADNRGVTTDYVKSSFGRGAVFSGREALDRRMIDGTFNTFDEFLSFITKDQGGKAMENGADAAEQARIDALAETPNTNAPADAPADKTEPAQPTDAPASAANAERVRIAELSNLAKTANVSAAVLADAIANGTTAEQFGKDLVALRESENVINTRVNVEASSEERHEKNVASFAARL